MAITYEALPHQLAALASRKRMVFLGGGVGCGKTDLGSVWTLAKLAQQPPGCIGVIAANTYGQLVDSTIRNVYKNWQAWGVSFQPAEVPRTPGPFTLRVQADAGRWREILCRSLDHFENLSGIECGWAWCDEVWQTPKEAIDLIQARVRDRRMSPQQLLMTTTLDDPTTWMYELFVDNHNPAIMDVIYAKTADNPFLPDGYVETLKATYSERMFRRMCQAEWVTLSEGLIYYAFGRDWNVDTCAVFDSALPVYWSHDFNIGAGKPMSSVLCHRRGAECHVFDEIILDTGNTRDAADEFRARYPGLERGTIVYGDSAGRARDTRSNTTDYQILADAGFVQQDVPRQNPSIRDRHNAVNAMLRNAEGVSRVKIHPRCKAVIKGLETVKLKDGANYIEEETREQHVTTALGYLIARVWPVVKYVPSGQKHWL